MREENLKERDEEKEEESRGGASSSLSRLLSVSQHHSDSGSK
jgi:hypothetical protein